MLRDALLVAAVYVYVFALISVGEALRRRGWDPRVTRRLIHLFAGDAILILPLFSSWYWPALIPIGLGALMTIAFMKRVGFLASPMVESEDEVLHVYGPVYYIISILILVAVLFDDPLTVVASVFVMAWGDGAAAILAPKLKRRHMYPWSDKSIEGSSIVFAFSLAAMVFTQAVMKAAYGVSASSPVVFTLAGAATAAVAEAMAAGPLRHFDNFTVPLITALILHLVG